MAIIRRDGKFQAQVTIKGKRRAKTFKTMREAKRWTLKMMEESDLGGVVHSERRAPKLDDYFKYFINEISPYKTERTIVGYKSWWNRWISPKLGHIRISSLTYDEGSEFLDFLLKSDLHLNSVNKILVLIKQVLNYATQGQGYRKQLSVSPLKGIKQLPKVVSEFNYWDAEELEFFIKNGKNEHWYDFSLLAVNTGMRLGELAGLKKDRIDFRKNHIVISHALKRSKKNGEYELGSTKTKETRYFPMNEVVKSILKKRCKGLQKGDYLFRRKNGALVNVRTFTDLNWNPLQGRVGIENKIRFHDLRHTFASHFMMNGGEIFVLQKLLGHKDIKSTLIYAHLSPRYLQNAAEIVVIGGGLDE